METIIADSAEKLGQRAGRDAADHIRESIKTKGFANVILATGTSQFETLKQLINEQGIDWSKVTMFHLDEYIGIPDTHLASFRKYLKERFIGKVPSLKATHLINGEGDPSAECERLSSIIANNPIDVALVGIGENGHLAFNDPPADFETNSPYIVVELDEACRKQQMGEGWFKTLSDVPAKAISMSVNQILKSRIIICSVPDERKAAAVKNTLEKTPDPMFPATALKKHSNCLIYLDKNSASLLSQNL